MATLNTIYYLNSEKQVYVNNNTNQFVISGYQLNLDPNLNANISLGNVPATPFSIGKMGTIAFDQNHLYYCHADNYWSRTRLAATWVNDSTTSPAGITNPNSWWYFTLNGDGILGNDSFVTNGNVTFNSNGINTSGTNNNGLFCYKTLAVPGWSKAMMYYGQPEGLYPNRFSTSFETKRINSSGFLLGSKYGQLNFHFEFSGNYLVFNMPKSAGGTPVTGEWHKIRSISQFDNSSYYQVVATFDPRNDSIAKFYVNGVLQGSANYHYTTVSLYNGGFSFNTIPQAQGFGIGGTPLGNINGNSSNTLTENNNVIVRNLGFWLDYALTQTEVTSLYNGGTFRKYPFV